MARGTEPDGGELSASEEGDAKEGEEEGHPQEEEHPIARSRSPR